jgi:hypothetical protein
LGSVAQPAKTKQIPTTQRRLNLLTESRALAGFIAKKGIDILDLLERLKSLGVRLKATCVKRNEYLMKLRLTQRLRNGQIQLS